MLSNGIPDNEMEHTVALPLYEWDLLAVLLQEVSEHTVTCNAWSGVQIPQPEWIPTGRRQREVMAVTRDASAWEHILTILKRIDEHFARHISSDFEFGQALPDFGMRKELMVRFYVYNGSPEDEAEDVEIGKDYRWIDIGTMAWYLAHQILAHMPSLKYIVDPLEAHELQKKEMLPLPDLRRMLTDEHVWLIRDVLTLAQMSALTLRDRDRQALAAISSDLLRAHHLDGETRDEHEHLHLLLGDTGETATLYEVSFLFTWNVGNEGMWTDVYTGPRLDVVAALLSPELYPIVFAHGVQHIIVPPLVNRPMRELPLAEFFAESAGVATTSYKIWARLPDEHAYLVGHAELDLRAGRNRTRYEVWSYVGNSYTLWGAVEWNNRAWDTTLLHAFNTWGIAKSFPENQLEQAIAYVFAQEYQPNILRLHPTLQEKK